MYRQAVTLPAGCHHYRLELDAGVAGECHRRRRILAVPAFVACVRSLRQAGDSHAAIGCAGDVDGGESLATMGRRRSWCRHLHTAWVILVPR